MSQWSCRIDSHFQPDQFCTCTGNKGYIRVTVTAKLTLLPMILCTSSSGDTGLLARSGLELLMLLERDRCRLLGRGVALDMVAYCMGIS